MFCKAKSAKKNYFFLRGDFRQFSNKIFYIWDHFYPLLFPKDSVSLKILDIRLCEVGAKRRLNGTSKVNKRTNRWTDGRTDRQTDRQTDISTYRNHRPSGPMLRKNCTQWRRQTDRRTWRLLDNSAELVKILTWSVVLRYLLGTILRWLGFSLQVDWNFQPACRIRMVMVSQNIICTPFATLCHPKR